MKLKCRPEDFRVEEKLKLHTGKRGRYAIYRLDKKLWNTLDVIREMERRHGMRRVGRAGLKDRYSQSTQFLSVYGEGPESVVESNYRLTLVGRADEPVSRDVLLGNRFTIVLRALEEREVESITAGFPRLARFGVPNYYDEQRLGSARHGQGFIARRLIAGHYNGALKLWLATPSAADDSRARRVKRLLADNWGDWRRCLDIVPPDGRPAIRHLAKHHNDFRTAVTLIPRAMLELFLNAYQAWLWNEVLGNLLDALGVSHIKVPYSLGTFRFYERLAGKSLQYLKRTVIPAPGPGAEFASDRVARITSEVLAGEGLEISQLKLKLRVRGLFFKPYGRAALMLPRNATVSHPKQDELYPGRSRVTLSFFLGPGSYATIVVKSLLPHS